MSFAKKTLNDFETFFPPDFTIKNTEMPEPRAYNGYVFYKKYRIVVEEIVEDKEVLLDRLHKLTEKAYGQTLTNINKEIRNLEKVPKPKKKKS